MNVLSLFDGISCGRVALERINIPVDKYYASEIDKHAIQISNKNYPDIIQLGDIKNWRNWKIDFSKIDILFAGFPCQAWSVAGKQKGDKDPRGELVHHLIGIWKKIRRENPNLLFLFENVKMKKDFINYINNLFECEPILINSSLVSAQNRERLYWTNIPGIRQPKDKGIMLKNIIHENHAQRTQIFVPLDEYIVPFDKTLKIIEKEVERGKVGFFRQDSQANRVYYIHDKSVTLCEEAGGGAAKMGQYLFGCITPDRINKRQNGQRFSSGEKFYTLTAQDQHGILIEGYIRKLTPIECERLQTLPDNYTAKGLDIYYYNIIQFIKTVINGDYECKNVKLKDAIIKYRISLQDYAINIIYDLSDTEQQNLPEIKLINQKNVKLQDVKEIKKQMMDFVCSIIKDSAELEKLNLTKNKNVNIAIESQLQKDCVINTIRITEGMETQNIQIKKEKNLINTDIKNLMGNMLSSIEKSMKMNIMSNYQKMILSIILTLISKIMTLKIFTDVIYPNTQLSISSLIKLRGNLLEVDLSNLKMENITSVSNSQRYKCLGNGWTVDVISHILSFIPKEKV